MKRLGELVRQWKMGKKKKTLKWIIEERVIRPQSLGAEDDILIESGWKKHLSHFSQTCTREDFTSNTQEYLLCQIYRLHWVSLRDDGGLAWKGSFLGWLLNLLRFSRSWSETAETQNCIQKKPYKLGIGSLPLH